MMLRTHWTQDVRTFSREWVEDEVWNYIDALIVEQTNRIMTLKGFIALPLKSSYLGQLSERCNTILESQLRVLFELRTQLREPYCDIRQVHRKVRGIIKNISVVESYGISSLRFQTEEVDFLNGVTFEISNRISLPLIPPSVSCLSTEYFYFEPVTRVIYVPQAEPYFLLHLPDLYHEIGHYVLSSSLDGYPTERLLIIANAMQEVFSEITQHFSEQIENANLNPGPKEIPMILNRIHAGWKSWLHEFLCDLFAIFTLGPAYAWSHLHLVAKTSDNVYQCSWLQPEDHPADEARMKLMLKGLKLTGFKNDVEEIQTKWLQLTRTLDSPDAYYQFAYAEHLLNILSEKFLAAMKTAGFVIFTPNQLNNSGNNDISIILNNAWTAFWRLDPEEYREWEKAQIETLKNWIQAHNR
jgi:hypothetical protein